MVNYEDIDDAHPLESLEPETIRVRIDLNACDMFQDFELDVTREQLEILQKVYKKSHKKHKRLNCYPELEVKVL